MKEKKKDRVSKRGIKNEGRPVLALDEEQILELARIHCTHQEIAAVMKCSVDTLDRRYAELIKSGYEDGKAKLRRLQWHQAERGNVQMLVHLGKQMLKQAEKHEISSTNTHTTTHEVTSLAEQLLAVATTTAEFNSST